MWLIYSVQNNSLEKQVQNAFQQEKSQTIIEKVSSVYKELKSRKRYK